MTDTNGAIGEEIDAWSYGLTDSTNTQCQLTNASGALITQQRDLDSGMGGLMDYKARFYSPYLNRFIQPDTIVPGMFNPQNLSRYSYVRTILSSTQIPADMRSVWMAYIAELRPIPVTRIMRHPVPLQVVSTKRRHIIPKTLAAMAMSLHWMG